MLEVVDVHKNFRGVHALKGVSTKFYSGEIHGLVGENGAGKSTLMKIICGMYPPTEGSLILDGETLDFRNPREAYNRGIRIVHQELSLIKSLSVAENIFIHKFKEGKVLQAVKRNALEDKAREMLESWDIRIDASEKVSNVSMGIRQLVEVARELSTGGRVIILDEPTSSLTVNEIEKLFEVMLKLKQSDLIIIFISHRLNEVNRIVDRISVLRDGELIGTSRTEELSPEQICKMIAGKNIAELYPKVETEVGTHALEIEGFTGNGYRNISLNIRWGEIVGLAGLVGAGRSELCRGIYGLDRVESGKLIFKDQKKLFNQAHKAIEAGIVLLGEDRSEEGIFPEMSVSLNTIMLKIGNIVRLMLLRTSLIQEITKRMVKKLNIVSFNPDKQKISQLSGGNQQKVVLARLLATNPEVLILDEPTRGVDIQNKTEIHKIMGNFVAEGGAVLMVSSELDEVIGICDRVYVLHEGNLVGEYSRNQFDKEELLKSMMGLTI